MKDRTTAGVLALFGGGLGLHKFYLGEGWAGCAYLLINGTGITWIVGFIEALIFFNMTDREFDRRYNSHLQRQPFQNYKVTVNRTRVTHTVVTGGSRAVSRSVERPAPARRSTRPNVQRTPAAPPRPEYARREPRDAEERERFTLLVARDKEGTLTPTTLSLATRLSVREARDALEALHNQGACEVEVDPQGVVYYSFPDLRRRAGQAVSEEEAMWDRLTGNEASDSVNVDA